MSITKNIQYKVSLENEGATLATIVRNLKPDLSWSRIKKLIAQGHIKISKDVCLDPARRVRAAEEVELLVKPDGKALDKQEIVIRHLDEHLVVVEKPPGVNSVRHPAERTWKESRKSLSPTLEDLVTKQIAFLSKKDVKSKSARLRVVQRLDKETSGLLVFARTADAERGLGMQFFNHSVERKYLALIPGTIAPQSIESILVRDRGDGRRGSAPFSQPGKKAVTHVHLVEKFQAFTLVGCQLETGRTHQIRIHLAEKGSPVCGEKVYRTTANGTILPDGSGFPRLALHAAELGFIHPISGEPMHWNMALPEDFSKLLQHLRK
ncbi:MAG: RluA family pseudouridine synthase [Planctomycetota bacterium]|jgi:23S rRNA pseudouridine1911/1915/1917 synthase|nr:RluA family pseudouridine synthase [Gemmataceae bacterium]NBT63133.1 RluA family pseudouridine synthase [Planctomycetia bacterium]RLS59714.1 MAG: RluA family pseudouridine synthase [Planctomycetota bacterium]MBJ7344614.1 RluA family pseudouridine synthase [Gemmataceae bacterium]MBJ7429922.1 RluA family pseudouridine synthase [Gemmataceae bacterium]